MVCNRGNSDEGSLRRGGWVSRKRGSKDTALTGEVSSETEDDLFLVPAGTFSVSTVSLDPCFNRPGHRISSPNVPSWNYFVPK
ncbi:hypothetical protein BH09CHL1_BH09CHL1_04310 [soil metagenome]